MTRIESDLQRCAFEDPQNQIFCPISTSENTLDNRVCYICIKARVKGKAGEQDLTPEEFLVLHPELTSEDLSTLLYLRRLTQAEMPKTTPIDKTPIRNIHQRLIDLPPPAVQFLLQKIRA